MELSISHLKDMQINEIRDGLNVAERVAGVMVKQGEQLCPGQPRGNKRIKKKNPEALPPGFFLTKSPAYRPKITLRFAILGRLRWRRPPPLGLAET